MPTARQRDEHQHWLEELTGIPTAAGREDRVVEWVGTWVARRRNLSMRTDAAGNLLITRRGRRLTRPLLITAHLDHPAFVVRRMLGERDVELEFRGGVLDPYFEDAGIEVFDDERGVHRGTVVQLDAAARPYKRVVCRLRRPATLRAGDVGRWALAGRGRTPTVAGGRLHAPACDDLAGVAAALSTLDVVRARKRALDVGVLLTRAEEVGFVGAIAACRLRTVPATSRLICLETSRSFPDSPIGGGPILRVGDKVSVFSPALTNRLSTLMEQCAKRHPGLRTQRKLMPGGTCEATTFSAYGHESTCVCLPLGNYHNMTDIDGVRAGRRPAKVGPEYISLDDYHGMVELLVFFAERIDTVGEAPIRDRMERLWTEHQAVLGE